jgi:hypothetical protein
MPAGRGLLSGRYEMYSPEPKRARIWRAVASEKKELASGAEAIPESWLERLAMRDFIREMADALLNLSQAAS